MIRNNRSVSKCTNCWHEERYDLWTRFKSRIIWQSCHCRMRKNHNGNHSYRKRQTIFVIWIQIRMAIMPVPKSHTHGNGNVAWFNCFMVSCSSPNAQLRIQYVENVFILCMKKRLNSHHQNARFINVQKRQRHCAYNLSSINNIFANMIFFVRKAYLKIPYWYSWMNLTCDWGRSSCDAYNNSENFWVLDGEIVGLSASRPIWRNWLS